MPQNDPNAVAEKESKNLQMYVSENTFDWFKDEWNDWSRIQRKSKKGYTQNVFIKLLLSLFMIYKYTKDEDEFKNLKNKYNKKVINENETTKYPDIISRHSRKKRDNKKN